VLQPGDEVRVDASGRAAIELGDSLIRLAPGAQIRLDAVATGEVELAQLAGRAYHRVDVPADATYRVATGPITWTGRGTAFDLERLGATGDAGAAVRVRALEHDVAANGAGFAFVVEEGSEALVELAGGPSAVTTSSLDAGELADPWLVGNARLDRELGHEVGVLDAAAGPTARPSGSDGRASPAPTADGPARSPGPTSSSPADGPVPTDRPAATPSSRPTATPSRRTPTPSPAATATPAPKPSPTRAIGTIALRASGCPGGVVLDWSAWDGGGTAAYAVVRSASSSIPAAFPPRDGAVLVQTARTTSTALTDGYDPKGPAGATAHYRALALDAAGTVLAASPVRAATPAGVRALGTLSARTRAGTAEIAWPAFGLPDDCFSRGVLVWSAATTKPTDLGARDGGVAIESAAAGSTVVRNLAPGTYWFALEAYRGTSLGRFLAGRSPVLEVVIGGG
jgi:hypothetical protein